MSQENRRPFGVTKAGESVELLTLDNGTARCEILTYAAALHGMTVPDRNGSPVEVVLGYDTLAEYTDQGGQMGAVVGRYANRIAGGAFPLNGETVRLSLNHPPYHIHGGNGGFSRRVWTVETLESDQAVLSLESADGEEGYPGAMQVSVAYRLRGTALEIRYTAKSSLDTVCNLTNHSYFNLDGHGAGQITGQEIQINASRYTPADKLGLPLGELAPVEGTPMDLRKSVPIGERVDDPFEQLAQFRGFDHNYVLDGYFAKETPPDTPFPAARAVSKKTGIVLEVETDLPGVQFYSATPLGKRAGKDGASYGPRSGFCLETQFFPDAPNHPNFPSPILRAGETYCHTTVFAFSTEA